MVSGTITSIHVQNVSIFPNWISVVLNNNSPSPRLLPQPLETTISLSISMNLNNLGTSCKWNHTIFVLWCLVYFTWRHVFKVLPYCSMCQDFIPFQGWIIFLCVYGSHFVYSSADGHIWVACLYFFNFGQLPLFPTKWKRETLWSQVSVGLKFFPFPMKTRQMASWRQIKENWEGDALPIKPMS